MAASCIRAAAARFGSCGRRWSVSAATPAQRCQSAMALGRGHLACCGGTSSQEPVRRGVRKAQGTAAGGGRGGGGRKGGGAATLWPAPAAAFSLFGRDEEDAADEAEKKQEELILLLKKAKLSVQRGQLQTASSFLHQAVALAHQTHNHQAIIYTYSQMANLAYVQGQLDSAQKLFKAAMSFMLSGGTPQDDNAVIEMSLKLATIYAEQDKVELAEHGFRFCTESLEAKLQKQSEVPAEQQTEEAEALRKETRLLLGLCLDSRSRFRASRRQLSGAVADCRAALAICRQEQGEAHPQTLVLMSDLATILDLQGRHDDALQLIQQAVELSAGGDADGEHPERHVLLGNMAGILLHTGRLEEAVRFYREALGLARRAGDQQAALQVEEGLREVERRRKTKSQQEA